MGKKNNSYKVKKLKSLPRNVSGNNSSRNTTSIVSDVLTGLMAGFEENSEAYHYVAHTGSFLFRSRNILNLGTFQAGNTFQTKFLEPLLETFYTKTGIDKLDTTSQQSYFNQVLRGFKILFNLYWRNVPVMLKPDLTRTSEDLSAPMALVDWNNLMNALEQFWQIPLLSLNLFAMVCSVKQLSPGSVLKRERPSYYLPFLGYMPLSQINSEISAYLAEYDSSLYRNQAKIPYVPFRREFVERVMLVGVRSNFWDVFGYLIPATISSGGAKYYFMSDGTSDVYWSSNFSFRVPDLYAIAPLFREYNHASGGMIQSLAATAFNTNIETIQTSAGGSWAAMPEATAIIFDPTLHNINVACGMTAAAARLLRIGDRVRRVETPLSTAASWNLRFFAFASKFNLVGQPLTFQYAGESVMVDPILIASQGNVISPTGRMAFDNSTMGGIPSGKQNQNSSR